MASVLMQPILAIAKDLRFDPIARAHDGGLGHLSFIYSYIGGTRN